ncbi:putative holin-like toxin [Paenibacillus terricola]
MKTNKTKPAAEVAAGILFIFGSFILALLTYINSNNKRK